jgi:hypothetical protein
VAHGLRSRRCPDRQTPRAHAGQSPEVSGLEYPVERPYQFPRPQGWGTRHGWCG